MTDAFQSYSVGDTLRIKHYPTAGGFRVWKVYSVNLGATRQEGTYELRPLDVSDNKPIQVPCLLLETHSGVERV